MTSREYLYHLPRESSARKLDRFRDKWLATETAVWTDRVVMIPPAFRHDLRFLERVEQLAVQKLRPHLLGDPKLTTGVGHRQAFAGVELNRPPMLNDLFGPIPFPGHDRDHPGRGPVYHSFTLDQFGPGRS